IVALLDLFPVHEGHTLVIPRRHVVDLSSCPGQLAGWLFQVSAQLAPGIVEAADAQGYNVWTANGAAAGQEIFHLHLHVLPRYDDDAFGLRFPKNYPREAARRDLDAMAQRIRALL
ncbi:MAG: HIT family protein, partial [Gemmatimonadales bacterium]